jgi:hypothetical protein
MTGMKRHLIVLIALIAVLDTVAALVFYHLHLDRDPGTRQQTYVGVWTLVSAVIVAVQLRKIRKLRIAAIRGTPATPVNPPAPASTTPRSTEDENTDSGRPPS